MKAIINGLLYDTEKEEAVCESYGGYATVYRTKNNRFFMNLSRKIITDENEIKEIVGLNYPDKYIELFGEVEEA